MIHARTQKKAIMMTPRAIEKKKKKRVCTCESGRTGVGRERRGRKLVAHRAVEAIDDDETPRARRVHELGRVRPRCQLDARGRTPPAVVALLRGN